MNTVARMQILDHLKQLMENKRMQYLGVDGPYSLPGTLYIAHVLAAIFLL